MRIDIRTKYRKLKHWYNIIYAHKEKSGIQVKVPFFKKLKYNLLGFSDFHIMAYDLEHNDYRNYISTWERDKLEDINGRFAVFLGEKVMFERVFGNFVHVPHIFCWVKNGKLINLDDNKEEVNIIEVLKEEKELIAKPTRSVGGGTGVHQLSYREGRYLFDDKEISQEAMIQTASSLEEYIITKKVSSHPYSSGIYPKATNTIRVVTVMDNALNEARLLFAFHRFGTNQSAPVDNISSGGFFAVVDNHTGIMSAAQCVFERGKEFSLHPDTGAKIEGTEIPNWEELISQLKKAHKCFPYYKFFAWDVAIDENSIPYILEINRGSDLSIQMIKPMRNEELGLYMKSQGILNKR